MAVLLGCLVTMHRVYNHACSFEPVANTIAIRYWSTFLYTKVYTNNYSDTWTDTWTDNCMHYRTNVCLVINMIHQSTRQRVYIGYRRQSGPGPPEIKKENNHKSHITRPQWRCIISASHFAMQKYITAEPLLIAGYCDCSSATEYEHTHCSHPAVCGSPVGKRWKS